MITEPDYITVKPSTVPRRYNVVWFRWSPADDGYTVHWISERVMYAEALALAERKSRRERVECRL